MLLGIKRTHVTARDGPLVTFEHGNQHISLRQRLIVSADGRHGFTTQQIGAILGPEHFFAEAFADDVPTAAFV